MRDHVSEPSTAPVDIRAATPGDWDSVATLLETSSLPLSGAREHLGDFIVAARGRDIVGCAAVERYDGVGLLRSVAVAESERGKGTGARLVQESIAGSAARGIDTLVLLTTTAADYFPKFGFERIARDEAPAAVLTSVEFREACPASAAVMRLTVRR